jgi:hypothetical protein
MSKCVVQVILFFVLFLFLAGCTANKESSHLEKISLDEVTPPDCAFDKYNCSDFNTQNEAQTMLEKCEKDVHGLDHDKDGTACEELSDN